MNRRPIDRDFEAAVPAAVMTVSELVMRASGALEAELGSVAVEGEISSFSLVQRSGHMYWTLKDQASQVECAMFRSDNLRLRFRVADGERVPPVVEELAAAGLSPEVIAESIKVVERICATGSRPSIACAADSRSSSRTSCPRDGGRSGSASRS